MSWTKASGSGQNTREFASSNERFRRPQTTHFPFSFTSCQRRTCRISLDQFSWKVYFLKDWTIPKRWVLRWNWSLLYSSIILYVFRGKTKLFVDNIVRCPLLKWRLSFSCLFWFSRRSLQTSLRYDEDAQSITVT